MPNYVVNRLSDALNDLGKPLRGSRIGVLGVAYKKDVDDPRESPSFDLMDRLLRKGAVISYNDPHIPRLPKTRRWPERPPMESQVLSADYLSSQDCILIVTDHSAYDYAHILTHAKLVVDTRNAMKSLPDPDNKIRRA